MKKRLFYAAVLLTIVAVSIVLKLNHPSEIRGLPACPSISGLGVTCPGCGSLRATHLLLNGDIASAWRHNPALLILGVPAFGLLLIECCIGVLGRKPLVIRWAPGWFGWAVLIAALVYFAARNVPGWDWLRPPE
jgi:hypothetical protein